MDLIPYLDEAKIVTRTSKTGSPYQILLLRFSNGYEYESYLKPEQNFILGKMLQEEK